MYVIFTYITILGLITFNIYVKIFAIKKYSVLFIICYDMYVTK